MNIDRLQLNFLHFSLLGFNAYLQTFIPLITYRVINNRVLKFFIKHIFTHLHLI